MAIKRRQNRN